MQEQVVKTLRWHGQVLPVCEYRNSRGQACSNRYIRIADMPQDLRRAIEHWATKIRAEAMLLPPPGCAYSVEDFEAFTTYDS